MKNGFSVELNIGGRILEYDDDKGLLYCKIPRQLVEDPKKLSFGIISNQAEVKLEDFDKKLRELVKANKINSTTQAKILFNDKVVLYGFVNESVYNDDDTTCDVKISDPLILLSNIECRSVVYKGQTTLYEIINEYFSQMTEFLSSVIDIKYDIDEYTSSICKQIKFTSKTIGGDDLEGTIPCAGIMAKDFLTVGNYICSVGCLAMYLAKNTIMVRRLV